MTKADIIIHGGNIFPGKDISGEYDYITVKDRRIQSMGSGSHALSQSSWESIRR